MSNTHKQFSEFDENLKIPKSKRDAMIKSRKRAEEILVKWFADNHPDYPISSWIQGSHKNHLNIRTQNESCDQDHGIYIDRDPDDSVSGTTLQKWIKEALTGSTSTTPAHKKRCIRNFYKAGKLGPYHIDYPVYYHPKDLDHPLLAVKDSELEESDPQEFTEWLDNQIAKNGQQLRRIIKYLKGWCDNISKRHKMPNGLTMTVLACNHFCSSTARDDESLHDTLLGIHQQLSWNWRCKIPATPHDDLLEQYDETFKNNFMDSLSALIDDSSKALDEESAYKASKKWRKHLGFRYPLAPQEKKVGNRAALAGIIGSNKPYFSDRKQDLS